MAVVISETFPGGAGANVWTTVPAVHPAGMASWGISYGTLVTDGTGLAYASGAGSLTSLGAANCLGIDGGTTNYGLGSTGRITVVLKWGSSAAYQSGGFNAIGAAMTFGLNAQQFQFSIMGNNAASSMQIRAGCTSLGIYINTNVTVAANTTYTVTADFTPTLLTVNAMGQTAIVPFTGGDSSGFNFITLGAAARAAGGISYDSLTVDIGDPVLVPWWKNYSNCHETI